MNLLPLRLVVSSLLALSFVLLTGCSSSPTSRIDANRSLYESWPIDMQSAVLEGRAVKDMTPEMVRMALGEPTRIEPKIGSSTGEETWFYGKSGGRSGMNLPLPNISLGGGIGGVGVSTGRRGGGGAGGSRGGSAVQEQEIVFQNGVVIRTG